MSLTSTASPFQIEEHDERELGRNEAFRAVRERLLSDGGSRFVNPCQFESFLDLTYSQLLFFS